MLVSLTLDLDGLEPDSAESACFALGAVSVTYTDQRDDPVLEPAPGEMRLWPATRLQAIFDGGVDGDAVAAVLAATLGTTPGRIRVQPVEDKAWEREWLADFHAMRFGRRLWVCPHHETVNEPDAVVVRLDPGLAFGTGTHATTALCLEWLDAHLAPGARVVDYGCGSGILALAAARLGAARAWAFDIDPQALVATRDNAARNGIEPAIETCESPARLPRSADVLLANILAGPLCELAPSFAAIVRPGGSIVLSGLLEEQAEEVMRAHRPWFDIGIAAVRDGWVALSGVRAPR
jgi:ribosomal protein L11 methyltransferase